MSGIIGNTVGTPMPRTNYNQTDTTKADYLLGREKLVSSVNGNAPENGDILLYGPIGYEPKVTLAQSDMSRYLYLGSDARRWMTTPEYVTVRAAFKNGAVVDFTTSTGLTVVDVKSNFLSAVIYTVSGDSKLYVVFDRKINVKGRFTITIAPAGILSEQGVAINDHVVAFNNSSYNLADILKNGYGGVTQQAILWDDGVYGENGEELPKDDSATVWGSTYDTYIFKYAGEVSSVDSLPGGIPPVYDQAMMTVGNDDMYICMGDDYLVQMVLRNFGVSTKSTYIIVKEELAATVSSVTILLGSKTIATLTQNDVASAFFGKRDTPSFDWLTSRYEVRFTVDGAVVEDLGVNGFDESKNFISAYSSIGCFISGVNGLTGYGESNEYCVIINPAVASINQVEIGSEPWKKIPHRALPTDFDLIEKRLLALENALGRAASLLSGKVVE